MPETERLITGEMIHRITRSNTWVDTVLYVGDTRVTRVEGVFNSAAASFIFSYSGRWYGFGLYWLHPKNSDLGATTWDTYKTKVGVFLTLRRAAEVLTHCQYLELDSTKNAAAFLSNHYDSEGFVDRRRLVRTPGTRYWQNESQEDDYFDIPPMRRFILSLGGSKMAEEIYKQAMQFVPSSDEVRIIKERAMRNGLSIDI